jgi:hypothetical protein
VNLGAAGVLAGVGHGFLDDPVGGAAGQVGGGAAGLVVQGHPHPGPARLGNELLDVGEGRLGQLPDGGVRAELERAGVDAQQRQAVAEDVVHLPGDLVAGALLGLLGPQLGLGLGPVGPVAQGQHQLAASSRSGAGCAPR